MRDVVGDLVERRVPVDLVTARREEGILLIGAGRGDVHRPHHADADALIPSGVEIAGIVQRHLVVGGVQRSDMHVIEAPLATDEYLVQRPFARHAATFFAACAAAASRTHEPSSCALRRRATRSALHGPLPLSTARNSSQSIGPKSCWPRAEFHRNSGSGNVTPSASACGTDISTNRWRSSSFVCRLIFQAIDCAVFGDSASGGPNIISDGHHQRLVASCTISRWAAVPRIIVNNSSYPCRWWKDSSLQIRIIPRA